MRLNKSLVMIVGSFLLLCIVSPAQLSEERSPSQGSEAQPEQHHEPQTTQRPEDTTEASNGARGILESFTRPLMPIWHQAGSLFGSSLSSAREMTQKAKLRTFEAFMRLYNKTYSLRDIPRRMALFFRRRDEIKESEQQFTEGKSSFVMRENKFMDLTEEELNKKSSGFVPPRGTDKEVHSRDRRSVSLAEDSGINVGITGAYPVSVDWRSTGCISEPISQMDCGACYAIGTMSVVEAMHCLRNRSAPKVSIQQIIDCAGEEYGYQNFGCAGGYPAQVIKYLQDVPWIARSSCYPMQWHKGTCALNHLYSMNPDCLISAKLSADQPLQLREFFNERDILHHVATIGPVITAVHTSSKFFFFGDGVFDDLECSNKPMDANHVLVIVGYGQENGIDYWLLKNSWGTTSWGVGGFAKHRRGNNTCSIGHWAWGITG